MFPILFCIFLSFAHPAIKILDAKVPLPKVANGVLQSRTKASRQQSVSGVGELLRKWEALIREGESCYLNKSKIQFTVEKIALLRIYTRFNISFTWDVASWIRCVFKRLN